MDKRTFEGIYPFMAFKILLVVLISQSTLSAPVNSTISYDAFLKNITEENCAFPRGIVLPFKDSKATLEFFSVRLKICAAPDDVKRSLEAIRLCNEIYDALRNITCHSDKNVQLPEIKIEFSEDVCTDISALKFNSVDKEESVLKHLTDKFVCDIMCEDDFLPACKVLLWSYKIQKQIEGIPLVQSIQNTPGQEDAAENGALSTTVKSATKPNQGQNKNPQIVSDPEVSAKEKPESNDKVDEEQKIISDDADRSELDHSVQTNADEKNYQEYEMPDETADQGKSDKQDQTDQQKKSPEIGNEAAITKQAVELTKNPETEIKEPKPTVKNQPIKETKIDLDEGPPKNSEPSVSEKTVLKNKPAIAIPEQTKDASNKTVPAKDIDKVQNILPPVIVKDNPSIVVKPVDATNTPKNMNPDVPGLNEISNKLPEKVSSPIIPSKVSPVNEVKISIKPEAPSTKDKEIVDTKVIPPVDKDEVISVTTVANLEKMEDGNGFPEQGDDMEFDGESDYDGEGIYDSRNKKQEDPDIGRISKPALAENEQTRYDPQRNSFVGSDDNQVIPLFPEQEDSHFFFYFLSLVLILMAGYLLFHNKQKIIALIVEGRHERRRRSHGVGYKKLETK